MVGRGAAAGEDREHPLEATNRRVDFAIDAIREAVKQKLGRDKAHGRFTIHLDWKSGQVELVTVTDATTYK